MAPKLGYDIPRRVMTNGHVGFRSWGSS